MSLLRPEQVWVALSPQAATCTRRQGWAWGAGAAEPVRLATQAGEGPDWRPAIEALRPWVSASAKGRGEVRVVLSNHFVRLLVVPWSDALSSDSERLALARHLFRSTCGARADGWRVQLSPAGHGQPALACAVDQALHDALATLLAGTAWRLGALQPLLTAVFNAYRHHMGNDGALFVLEPGRSTCVVFRAGRWEAASVTRRVAASADAAVDRERQVLGLPEDLPAFVYQAGQGPGAATDVAGPAAADPPRYRRLGAASPRGRDAALALFAVQP